MNKPVTIPFVSKVAQTYQGATKGLQNYGKNLAKSVVKANADFDSEKASYYASAKIPNPFKASSYK